MQATDPHLPQGLPAELSRRFALERPENSRHAAGLAAITTLFVIGGSQWGMILLSYIYSTSGRADLTITPELVLGSGAILTALLLAAWHKCRFLDRGSNWPVLLLLALFVFVCIVSESNQPTVGLRNFVTVATLFAYVLLGGYCGYFLGGRWLRVGLAIAMLAFLLWHAGLVYLGIAGHMSLESLLVGATLSRLEVTGGFTATELPIYTGMQLPLAFMILFSGIGGALRVAAWLLVALSAVLLALTASVGAIIATALVLILFVAFGSRAARRRSLLVLALAGAVAASIGSFYIGELYLSVAAKFDDIATGGGRAQIYGLLVDTALNNPWTGIGKSNFQYINNFRYDGTGVYPHNNVLGIAAEFGIPAAVMYTLFAISAFIVLISAARQLKLRGENARSLLLVAVAGILLYQQARGMLHDTWLIKELYFWIGFGLGVASLPVRTVNLTRVTGSGAAGAAEYDDKTRETADGLR